MAASQVAFLSEAEHHQQSDIQRVIDTFRKWLYIEEDYNITGPLCAAIANFAPGEPDIVGLIGPSGSLKTEIIRSLGETENDLVYPISSLTEKTLVSGYEQSNDLAPRLKGRLLTIKDLTSLLSKKEESRSQIFADFREFTDGYIKKEYGNGITKEYRGLHSSILFGSTNAIERYYSMYSNLGQRMIFLRPQNDPTEARRKAEANRGHETEMRAEIRAVVDAFMHQMVNTVKEYELPGMSSELLEDMGELYDLLAIARTTIHKDWKGDIDEIPEPEFPTRISKTVSRLCEVHALIHNRDKVTFDDYSFGVRIILDNVPTQRWQVLNVLSTDWEPSSKISSAARLPPSTTKRILEELNALGLADRLSRDEKSSYDGNRRSDSYMINPEFYQSVEQLKGVIRGGGIYLNKVSNIPISNYPPQLMAESGQATGEPAPAPGSALRAIYRPSGAAEEYSALALNLYNGCSHGCKYCYAPSMRRMSRETYTTNFNEETRKSNLSNIEQDLITLGDDKTPIHLCFIGDPYDRRRDNDVTRNVLSLFKKYGHPFQVLTKGGMLACLDYNLYFNGCRFGTTLTFDNEQDSLEWEPDAALPAERIESLKLMHELGVETWVSCEPVIDPAQTLHLIEMSAQYVDYFWIGKWNHDKRANDIDYVGFKQDAETLLKRLGKSYGIKDALMLVE